VNVIHYPEAVLIRIIEITLRECRSGGSETRCRHSGIIKQLKVVKMTRHTLRGGKYVRAKQHSCSVLVMYTFEKR